MALHRPHIEHDDEVHAIMKALGRQRAALTTDSTRLFMDIDLTMAQFRALTTLRLNGRLSGKELASKLGVTPASVIPLIDRLEAQAYVRRVPDHHDRRLTWIELTPHSDRLFGRLWPGGQARMLAAIKSLPPTDRRDLLRILNRIADHLEAGHQAADRAVS